MSYHRGFGADAVPAPEQAPTVAQKTPSFSKQALSAMGVTALPWIPVAGGAWLGGKLGDDHGKLWGALGGFAFSFFTLRYIAKQMAGNIT